MLEEQFHPSGLIQGVEELARGYGLKPWFAGQGQVDRPYGDLEDLEQSDIVFCVWGLGKRGEEASHESTLQVSQLELEVLKSLMYGKPIHFFVRRGFQQDPLLPHLIVASQGSQSPRYSQTNPLSDREIVQRARDAIKDQVRRSRIWQWKSRRTPAQLIQGLARQRAPEINHRADTLRFLAQARSHPLRELDAQRIRQGLAHAAGDVDQLQRLQALWPAIREAYLCAPLRDHRTIEHWPLWNDLLGRWASMGAWLGLHGHFLLSPLAALNSMAWVRQQLRQTHRYLPPDKLMHPFGSIASAHYSIAQRLPNFFERRKRYLVALEQVDEGLDDCSGLEDGLLAIRGSICLGLGRLAEATSEYAKARDIRQSSGAEPKEVAELDAALGYSLLFQGQIGAGRQLLEEAQDKTTGQHSGFRCRILRQLSVAYRMSGSWRKARKTREEARVLAQEINALDQDRF